MRQKKLRLRLRASHFEKFATRARKSQRIWQEFLTSLRCSGITGILQWPFVTKQWQIACSDIKEKFEKSVDYSKKVTRKYCKHCRAASVFSLSSPLSLTCDDIRRKFIAVKQLMTQVFVSRQIYRFFAVYGEVPNPAHTKTVENGRISPSLDQ